METLREFARIHEDSGARLMRLAESSEARFEVRPPPPRVRRRSSRETGTALVDSEHDYLLLPRARPEPADAAAA